MLIWLFIIPFVSALILLFVPNKKLSLFLNIVPAALLAYGAYTHNLSPVLYKWFKPLNIDFFLKADNLSILFLGLMYLVVHYSLYAMPEKEARKSYWPLVLLLQGLLTGLFLSRDLVLFTIFWEAMLLPLFFIIREREAVRFLLYMMAGSLLMVAGVVSMYFLSPNNPFNMDLLAQQTLPYAPYLAGVFFLAFAVKTPLFPFHGWLADTYTAAPWGGTILLSAILSKAGIYGFLRIGVEIFPRELKVMSPVLLALAITGVLYGALAAWKQIDFKRLLAYSSFSHVNFVLAGIFVMNEPALLGGIVQALNHGITITALLLIGGYIEKKTRTTNMRETGGLVELFPCLCWITLFFVLSSIALPGLNNFIGEFLVFYGLFGLNPWLAFVLGISIILSAMYMLKFMKKIFFGPVVGHPSQEISKDNKLWVLLPLMVIILAIGLYPSPLLKWIPSLLDSEKTNER